MNSKIITLQELSSLLEVNKYTLRTWLQGYRFTKFYYNGYVEFNQEFIDKMVEYLKLKHKSDMAKFLKSYYKKISCL